MEKGDMDRLFKKIGKDTLEEIFSELKLGPLEKKAHGPDILKDYALESGARTLIQQLKLETLKAISNDLKFYDENQAVTKNSATKKFAEKVKNDGLDETLKALKKDNLQAILENGLGVDVQENTAKAMAEQLASEVRSMGVEVMLSKLKNSVLESVCEDLKIDVSGPSSNTQLVIAIVDGEAPEKKEAPAKPKILKDKPKLAKGVDYHNIAAHYAKTELEEFCKEKDIYATGTKMEVARVIATFLETGKKPAKPEKKPPKEKKEKTEKKTKKKAAVTKKAEGSSGTTTRGRSVKKYTTKEKSKTPNKGKKEEDKEKEDSADKENIEKKTPASPKKTPASPKKTPVKRKADDDGDKRSAKKGKKSSKEEKEKEKENKEAEDAGEDLFLKDFTFVLSGKFDQTQANIKKTIKKHGGKVADDINDDTTHLLVADTSATNAKVTKAKEKKLEIVDMSFIEKNNETSE